MTGTDRDAYVLGRPPEADHVPAPIAQVTCVGCGKPLTAVRVALQRPETERGRRCGPCGRERQAGASRPVTDRAVWDTPREEGETAGSRHSSTVSNHRS